MISRTLARRPATALALAALLLWMAAAPAEATNGYLVHGIGTRAKALAGAGVAFPQDALAGGTNPAGMALVGKRYDVGVALFSPSREYTVTGGPSLLPSTFGLTPGTVESDSKAFFVPNFGANWQVTPRQALGLLVYGQGGMNTDYPAATFYGTRPTGVDLSQLFVVPTWAVGAADGRHAFGIGLIAAYQTFEIQGVQAFGGFSADPARLTNNGADTSTGFGARLGYLGRWNALSFGLAYQSEISMEEFDEYAGLFAGRGGFDIPANYTVGVAWRFGGGAVFLLDYQEIFYSEIESVGNPLFPALGRAFQGDAGGMLGADAGPGFGWRDMEVIKAGVQWGAAPWVWRLGFSTGDQPIPETEMMFNILAPGIMEEHFTGGFTRELSGGKAISLALMVAPSSSISGPNPMEMPGMQTIELEMSQWELELGFSWGF
ncbi:MAG: outer membrane protein transport protein [Thermoanaerobaculia bacterium]|nr:outer membrane protein transport protein [Thermoanaerobaculia bacterium]